jgi:hypothetical protein
MRKTEVLYKDIVMRELQDGATCEEVVKRHPGMSLYYARKWSGDIYRNKDLSHYVRDRYKWIVLETCAKIEDMIVGMVGKTEDIPEKEWMVCLDKMRRQLYLMLEDVVRKN